MKKLIFTLLFLLSVAAAKAQDEIPTHIIIGWWTMETAEDTTSEHWVLAGDETYTGMTLYTNKSGTLMSETMRLFYDNGKLKYCATIMEQDPANPQGEICFTLTSYKDLVFVFENPAHDFPKKITYDFSDYNKCKARVEDGTKSFDLEYKRVFDFYSSREMRGKFIKEEFVNKGGRKLDGVFDYFFVIQGIKYFVKIRAGSVKKDEIDRYLGQTVKADVTFLQGLWDADDDSYQSRYGKYVTVQKISPFEQ